MVIDVRKKNKAEGVGSAGWRQGRLPFSTSEVLEGLTEKGTSEPKSEGVHSALGIPPFTRIGPHLAEWPGRQFETD